MAWAVGEVTASEDIAEAAEAGTLWVAEIGGAVAGFLLGEGIGEDFHIWELAVARERQRRGIGRVLLETALSDAARRGFARATLTTDRSLAWNAPWYRALGFAEVSDALSARLAAQLATERDPQKRCAMVRDLAG